MSAMADTPRYRQIADDLRTRLANGEFPVGTALPPIAVLQVEYGVSGLNTVRGAHKILQGEGLIAPSQGKGTFVVALPEPDDREALRKDVAELRKALDAAQSALARISSRVE